MAKVRAHIIISGRVQGVFFRYTMQQVSHEVNVTGWAKNLPDGRVEAVLEGNKENVGKVIEWAREGPPQATVKNVDIKLEGYTGEFRDFSIKYF